MDQDIAVRLANEGVPVRAIARAVRLPSADVRIRLAAAREHGELIDLPCEDWPPGYPREQRLCALARIAARNRAQLHDIARSVFGLPPAQVSILLLLLSSAGTTMPRARLAQISACTSVHVCRLRRNLQRFGLRITTVQGVGYGMPSAHRRKAMDMILAATGDIGNIGD